MRYQLWKYDGDTIVAVGSTENRSLHPWITPSNVSGHRVIGFVTRTEFREAGMYTEAPLLKISPEQTICFGWQGDTMFQFILEDLKYQGLPSVIAVIELTTVEQSRLYEDSNPAEEMFSELIQRMQAEL